MSRRIVIVGGVAGGASAATRARRVDERAKIVLLERSSHVSYANCGMPYYIGGVIADRDRLLVQTAHGLARRYNIDVRTRHEVVDIDRAARQVEVIDHAHNRRYREPYDKLVLSPGAEASRPAIAGSDDPRVFVLRSMDDMDAIKGHVESAKPSHALVVGGGYIGLEVVGALRHRGLALTLVELAPQVLSTFDPEMVSPVHDELRRNGVDLRLGVSVAQISPQPSHLAVRLSDGETVECGMVLLAVGVRPENKLARDAGLAIGETGGIVVDEHMRTSDPDIFAVGDVVEVDDHVGRFKAHIPLAGPANRQGRIAADNALGRSSTYGCTQGTAIVKVFELAAAQTGLSEKTLLRRGMKYDKVYVHPASHASYYPGAAQISLKLLFDPSDGEVLGAQAVGAKGVDKRIDVLAVAIRAGLTVYDLEELELCYAPPFGSAKDVVNYAGFVAANALRGDVRHCHAAEVHEPLPGQMLLDVRTPAEVQAGTIGGSTNIPVDELRARMGELPRDKELLVFCQVGLRGYLACRLLSQHGFACRNLTGGYKTYHASYRTPREQAAPPPPPAEARSDAGEQEDAPVDDNDVPVVKEVDATGLACPGPVLRLQAELMTLSDSQRLRIVASDPGFAPDVAAWCRSTGNRLVDLQRTGATIAAVVERRAPVSAQSAPASGELARNKTLIVFSGDFDKAVASFIIANGAAAMGSKVTMFFTFWGLNVLRRPEGAKVSKGLIQRMLGWMMPRGAGKLVLSKMNMLGVGTRMIRGIMRKHNVPSLPELIASARAAGVRLVACRMTMDLMGFDSRELIEGVEEGGVATFLETAERGNVNLFV